VKTDTIREENACFKVERVVLNALANKWASGRRAKNLAPSAIYFPSSSEKPIHHSQLDRHYATS
jgi:hypothetical protein